MCTCVFEFYVNACCVSIFKCLILCGGALADCFYYSISLELVVKIKKEKSKKNKKKAQKKRKKKKKEKKKKRKEEKKKSYREVFNTLMYFIGYTLPFMWMHALLFRHC